MDLGYTSSDGVKFTKKDKLDPIDTWQTVAAIRYVYSDRDFSVKFSLLQINGDTLPFFFGGGTVSSGTAGLSYNIAAAPQVQERALGIEFKDGPDKGAALDLAGTVRSLIWLLPGTKQATNAIITDVAETRGPSWLRDPGHAMTNRYTTRYQVSVRVGPRA